MIRIKLISIIVILVLTGALCSCETEDPGPLPKAEKTFSIVDFDRIEMGSALVIKVEQSNFFEIKAKGDRRNVDDLVVYKNGNTLIIKFDEDRNRRHETEIFITMPALRSAHFSGGSISNVSGFSEVECDVYLSGASIAQVDVEASELNMTISGASIMTIMGEGNELHAEVSGASELNAFNYYAGEAQVKASGASLVKVFANDVLDVTATGASAVLYRGHPTVTSNVSGASSLQQD